MPDYNFYQVVRAIGIVCLFVALGFGGCDRFVRTTGDISGNQSTYASAGASLGFAVAGGLCFVAAAIATGNRRCTEQQREDRQPQPEDRGPSQRERPEARPGNKK